MAGPKTHAQQQRIIQGRENTKNAGDEFDAEADLKMPPEEHAARLRGADLDTEKAVDSIGSEEADDRPMTRGEHQESRHHKNRVDDD